MNAVWEAKADHISNLADAVAASTADPMTAAVADALMRGVDSCGLCPLEATRWADLLSALYRMEREPLGAPGPAGAAHTATNALANLHRAVADYARSGIAQAKVA